MATKLKFGLLLPHFGEYGSVERCIEGAKKAEEYGFDSVWVRDHLVFEPHGMEGEDNTHIEGWPASFKNASSGGKPGTSSSSKRSSPTTVR